MDWQTLDLGAERSLHVAVNGAGEDIVLIHGALTTGCDWEGPPLDALAGLGRLVVVDRPGHGLSRRPRYRPSPRLQAEQIRDGLSRIGAGRPLLVAHSLGAMVALAYAEQFPDAIAGLVLVAPLAFP